MKLDNITILVTGAAGSIGAELIRLFRAYNVRCIAVDRNENDLYLLYKEFEETNFDLQIVYGDLRDEDFIETVFNKYSIDIVYHTAANKQVPLMESNPFYLIKNNIDTTHNLLKLCHKHKVKKMILLSTDKAVNPKSKIGVSKRICELLINHFNAISNTHFCAIRLGNVMYSKGSVSEVFDRQIQRNKPLYVNNADARRYFISLEKAANYCLKVLQHPKNYAIFIGNYGEQMTIREFVDSYKKHLKLKEVQIIDLKSLRSGDKMSEDLLFPYETQITLEDDFFGIDQKYELKSNWYDSLLRVLEELTYQNAEDSFDFIKKML